MTINGYELVAIAPEDLERSAINKEDLELALKKGELEEDVIVASIRTNNDKPLHLMEDDEVEIYRVRVCLMPDNKKKIRGIGVSTDLVPITYL